MLLKTWSTEYRGIVRLKWIQLSNKIVGDFRTHFKLYGVSVEFGYGYVCEKWIDVLLKRFRSVNKTLWNKVLEYVNMKQFYMQS